MNKFIIQRWHIMTCKNKPIDLAKHRTPQDTKKSLALKLR